LDGSELADGVVSFQKKAEGVELTVAIHAGARRGAVLGALSLGQILRELSFELGDCAFRRRSDLGKAKEWTVDEETSGNDRSAVRARDRRHEARLGEDSCALNRGELRRGEFARCRPRKGHTIDGR